MYTYVVEAHGSTSRSTKISSSQKDDCNKIRIVYIIVENICYRTTTEETYLLPVRKTVPYNGYLYSAVMEPSLNQFFSCYSLQHTRLNVLMELDKFYLLYFIHIMLQTKSKHKMLMSEG